MLDTIERESLDVIKIGISQNLDQKVESNQYLYSPKIIRTVENILGLEFFGIADFVEKELFTFDKDKSTVLVTRRCLLLVDWFIGYLINKKFKRNSKNINYINDGLFPFLCVNGKKNYIVSDKADISLLYDKIEEITIVDDICIHGISISKTAERISKEFKDKYRKIFEDKINIETCVYMISKETIKEYPDRFYVVSLRAEWKKLSIRIIDFINYLNLPYVSYLNSYTLPKFDEKRFKTLINTLSDREDYICTEFNTENNRLGKSSYFLVEKNGYLNEYELIKCVRIYYNKNIETVCIMPYVILKSIENLTKNKILNLISYYININKNIENYIINEFNNEKLDYKYSFLSFIASQSYWHEICEKLSEIKEISISDDLVQDNIGCLEKFFGVSIDSLLLEYKIDRKSSDIFKLNKYEIDNELFNEYIKYTSNEIDNACIKSWLEFEKFGQNKNFRQDDTGYIELERILLDIFNKVTNDKKENSINSENIIEADVYFACLLNILNYCDQGKLNITCIHDRGKSFLKAGELGCLCVNRVIFNNEYKKYMRSLLGYNYYRYLFI